MIVRFSREYEIFPVISDLELDWSPTLPEPSTSRRASNSVPWRTDDHSIADEEPPKRHNENSHVWATTKRKASAAANANGQEDASRKGGDLARSDTRLDGGRRKLSEIPYKIHTKKKGLARLAGRVAAGADRSNQPKYPLWMAWRPSKSFRKHLKSRIRADPRPQFSSLRIHPNRPQSTSLVASSATAQQQLASTPDHASSSSKPEPLPSSASHLAARFGTSLTGWTERHRHYHETRSGKSSSSSAEIAVNKPDPPVISITKKIANRPLLSNPETESPPNFS